MDGPSKGGMVGRWNGAVPLLVGVAGLSVAAAAIPTGAAGATGSWARTTPAWLLGSGLLMGLASAVALLVTCRRMLDLRRELSRRVDSERMLSWVAEHDPLTGVGNRRRFQAAVRELSTASAGANPGSSTLGAAVLFVDLDRFKDVNDSYGHAVGDEVLRVVAARLRAAVRPDDLVTRYGGDEFLILARDIDADGALSLANRVSSALAQPVTAGGRSIPVGASVGLAQHDAAISGEALLREADAAMYHDKRQRAARRPDDQDSAAAA